MTAAAQAIGTTTSTAATSTINSGLSGIANNYQTFLSLLTTQLKNQDPTSPLDTNQFTQQLTQMTGVEQQLLSNQLLQQLVNQNQGGGLTNAVGLIGKTVTSSGNTAVLSGGASTWNYNLPSTAAAVNVSISDSSGNVVWTGPATGLGSGAQTYTWNGQNQAGQKQADGGVYTATFTATSAAGSPITPTTSSSGVATAVQQVNGQTMVTVGKVQVPLTSITGVNG
jgi:flagellar basal-body rod modification protein FlgD